jgi:glycerol-3-phosphate cytidylyltransferase
VDIALQKSMQLKSDDQIVIGFTCGAFDLLHAGHVLMLEEAKSVCDYLIVGLHTDPTIDRLEKNKPVQSLVERTIQLNAIKYVDQTICYQTEAELLELLQVVQPDVRIIGEDYKDKDFTGKQWCFDNDVYIYYNSRQHTFSSTELRTRIKKN